MEEIFITNIHIKEVRHLKDIPIHLSDTERKHLILTGKNGSGKTSVLESLLIFLSGVKQFGFSYSIEYLEGDLNSYKDEYGILRSGNVASAKASTLQRIKEKSKNKDIKCGFNKYVRFEPQKDITFTDGSLNIPDKYFLVTHFEANRRSEFDEPQSPKSLLNELDNSFIKPDDNLSKYFWQYLLNNRFDRLNALDIGWNEEAVRINKWFDNFELALKKLFDDSTLELFYEHDKYSFKIKQFGKDPFNLNQLASGYSAILRIVCELILRMDNKKLSYDLQGIVLIDEIETHLHIDLQKKILPFLTSFFPKIQFIVTTHSPFVLMSEPNAVIFDLEKKQRVEDLSGYSLDAIVESYFDSDKYSDELKKQISEYETLLEKDFLTEDEEERKVRLRIYFRNLPKTLAPELSLKINQLERPRPQLVK